MLEAIPARLGRAFRMAAGQCIEVVNPHGTQVADTWAFNTQDPFEYLAMDQTRSVNLSLIHI